MSRRQLSCSWYFLEGWQGWSQGSSGTAAAYRLRGPEAKIRRHHAADHPLVLPYATTALILRRGSRRGARDGTTLALVVRRRADPRRAPCPSFLLNLPLAPPCWRRCRFRVFHSLDPLPHRALRLPPLPCSLIQDLSRPSYLSGSRIARGPSPSTCPRSPSPNHQQPTKTYSCVQLVIAYK